MIYADTQVNTRGRANNGQMGLAGYAYIGVGTSGPFKQDLLNYGLEGGPKEGCEGYDIECSH